MTKRNILKISLLALSFGIMITLGVVYYLFNLPHRDIQELNSDYNYNVNEIVYEYLTNPKKANDKYIGSNGKSKIIEINGIVAEISRNFNNQKVILLKSKEDKVGVSCTFVSETEKSVENIQIGQFVTIKGIIRSGVRYDKDLKLFENIIMEKSKILKK